MTFTVFCEIPAYAICAIGICSARCNRWISAQSTTLSTSSLPGRISKKLVNLSVATLVRTQLPPTTNSHAKLASA